MYVCPYLMWADKRTKGAAVEHRIIHSDYDDELDVTKVQAVHGFAVASGSPGHAHVYVPLSDVVTAPEHRMLCEGLRDYLGARDSKITDNDVLRPPGTFNHKPTGEPAPVTWLVQPDGVRVDVNTLARHLGVDLNQTAASTTGATGQHTEPVDLARHPRVKAAVEKNTGDRSRTPCGSSARATTTTSPSSRHARSSTAAPTSPSGSPNATTTTCRPAGSR